MGQLDRAIASRLTTFQPSAVPAWVHRHSIKPVCKLWDIAVELPTTDLNYLCSSAVIKPLSNRTVLAS